MKVILHPKDTYRIWQWILQSKVSQKWVHLVLDLKDKDDDPIHFMDCRKYIPMPWLKRDALGLFVVDLPVKFTPWIWERILVNRANSVGSTFELEVEESAEGRFGQVIRAADKTVYPDPENDFDEAIPPETETEIKESTPIVRAEE